MKLTNEAIDSMQDLTEFQKQFLKEVKRFSVNSNYVFHPEHVTKRYKGIIDSIDKIIEELNILIEMDLLIAIHIDGDTTDITKVYLVLNENYYNTDIDAKTMKDNIDILLDIERDDVDKEDYEHAALIRDQIIEYRRRLKIIENN